MENLKYEIREIDAVAYDDGWVYNDSRLLSGIILESGTEEEFLMELLQDELRSEYEVHPVDDDFELVLKSNQRPFLALCAVEAA